jgi:predicted nucleic-acid-binding Zn-ribbon protein
MQESKKCTKCGSQMEKGGSIGYYSFDVRLLKTLSEFRGDKIIPFYCKNCGYIELFSEKVLNDKH